MLASADDNFYYTSTKVFATTIADGLCGDGSGNGVLSIMNAQVVYEIARGAYVGSEYETMRAHAYVTGDGRVYAEDALAIQSVALCGWSVTN